MSWAQRDAEGKEEYDEWLKQRLLEATDMEIKIKELRAELAVEKSWVEKYRKAYIDLVNKNDET